MQKRDGLQRSHWKGENVKKGMLLHEAFRGAWKKREANAHGGPNRPISGGGECDELCTCLAQEEKTKRTPSRHSSCLSLLRRGGGAFGGIDGKRGIERRGQT